MFFDTINCMLNDTLPHTILFAPDGTIIARRLHGENIDKKLANILNYK